MSPSDKYAQESWAAIMHNYELGSPIFFAVVAGAALYLGSVAKLSKKPQERKKLYLARKAVLYIGILGWIVFTGIIFGIIPIGL